MNKPVHIPNAWDELCHHCASQPPGPVADVAAVERLLAACWDALQGDYGGMAGHKLLDRMEAVAWSPPVLTFQIERHGGTVLGSTRAEMQHWQVDVDRKTATLAKTVHRQLRPMQPRLNVEPLVEEIVRLIVAMQQDDRLRWNDDGSVKVLVGKIIPARSAVKQTLAGRRKRFRKALLERLEAECWGLVAYPYTFSRKWRRATPPSPSRRSS